MWAGHADVGFLGEPHDYVGRPLASLDRRASRVLFAPGMGLGLGDQFMCIPLVHSLGRHYAGAAIDLFTQHPEFWYEFAGERVRVKEFASDEQVLAAARSLAYDITILGYFPGCLDRFRHAHAPTVFCAGTDLADYRAFFAEDGACREIPLCATKQRINEARRFAGLFDDFGLRVELPEPAVSRLNRPVETNGLRRARVLLHPGTAKLYKRWPIERWHELAAKLTSDGAHVFVSSGSTREDLLLAQCTAGGTGDVSILSQMSLDQFVRGLSSYDIAISADTFLPHAAQWVDGPLSYTLYGPTDPFRFCPWGSRHHFGSLDASPAAVADALDLLLRVWALGPEAVAARDAGELIHAARTLTQSVDAWAHGSSPPAGLQLERWRGCFAPYCDAIAPPFRTVLSGHPSLEARVVNSIENEAWPTVKEILMGTPAYRSARLVLESVWLARSLHSAAG